MLLHWLNVQLRNCGNMRFESGCVRTAPARSLLVQCFKVHTPSLCSSTASIHVLQNKPSWRASSHSGSGVLEPCQQSFFALGSEGPASSRKSTISFSSESASSSSQSLGARSQSQTHIDAEESCLGHLNRPCYFAQKKLLCTVILRTGHI